MTHNCLTQSGYPVMLTMKRKDKSTVEATGICTNPINIGDEFIAVRANRDGDTNRYRYFVKEVVERRKPKGNYPKEVANSDSFYRVILNKEIIN